MKFYNYVNFMNNSQCFIINIGKNFHYDSKLKCEITQISNVTTFLNIGSALYCKKNKKIIGIIIDFKINVFLFYAEVLIISKKKYEPLIFDTFYVIENNTIFILLNFLISKKLINFYKFIINFLFKYKHFIIISNLSDKIHYKNTVLFNIICFASIQSLLEFNWRYNWYKAYKTNWCYHWSNFGYYKCWKKFWPKNLIDKNDKFIKNKKSSLKDKWKIIWYNSNFNERSQICIFFFFNKINLRKELQLDSIFNLTLIYCMFYSLFKQNLTINNHNKEINKLKKNWYNSDFKDRVLTIIYYLGIELKMCEVADSDNYLISKTFMKRYLDFTFNLINCNVIQDLQLRRYNL